jgi:hypothetical protein
MALMLKVLAHTMEYLLGSLFFGNYSRYLSDNHRLKNNFNKLNKNLKDWKRETQLVSLIKEVWIIQILDRLLMNISNEYFSIKIYLIYIFFDL